jgi:hypothetical protein
MPKPMPAIFFGHGSPINAIARNAYTEAWSALGTALPRPRAILAISAHWYVPETAVTAMAEPRTIHDFVRCVRPHAALCCVSRALPGDSSLLGANCTARDKITLAAFTSAWSW